ncbi:MAG: biotin--[acetyl-CoA-carboxylase] ligase [Planctomycetes bacterium]|nr:biotin--[acetyl-CoA-carboxylase] ligase [Planctomycetota bacterium]
MSGSAIIHAPLLDALLHRTEPIARESLTAAIGLRGMELLQELRRLADAGCVIEEHPQHGLTLLETGLGAWEDYLRWRCPLAAGEQPRRVEVYRTTGSTQDRARALVESLGRAAHGAVIVADEQTAGRGRLGRRWVAPPGKAVTFTMVNIAAPGDGRVSVDHHMFATAVAVARAAEAVTRPSPIDARIKWPNDVMCDGRKLAGILVETFSRSGNNGTPIHAAIIGVGVNVSVEPGDVSDPALRDRLTSLVILGHRVDRLRVLAGCVGHIGAALAASPHAELVAEWKRRCTIPSRRMEWESDGRRIHGHVIDLDPYDGLIVRTDSGATIHLPAATTTVIG